jgi:DNA replication regulator DPB11
LVDSFRNHLQETAVGNGAEFTKDLTKSVTHLLAHEASGRKYEVATRWKIHVVSVKWFTDSLERGMILDESLYHPLRPLALQGDGSWNRSQPDTTVKRKSLSEVDNRRSTKLRRVTSIKLGDQNEGIWGDIVGKGDADMDTFNNETIGSEPGRPATNIPKAVAGESKALTDEATIRGRNGSGVVSPNESNYQQQSGFLDGCVFAIHCFRPKQVSGPTTISFLPPFPNSHPRLTF